MLTDLNIGSPNHRITCFHCLSAGFCTAYLVFIKENLASYSGEPASLCIAALLPFLLAMSMLRGVAALAPFSLIADAANFIGANFMRADGCSQQPLKKIAKHLV